MKGDERMTQRRVWSLAMAVFTILIAVGSGSAASGCSGASSNRSSVRAGPTRIPGPPRPAVSDDADCGALTRTQCMAAKHCTLVLAQDVPPGAPGYRNGVYVCRPAQGACEVGFAQWDLPGGGADLATPAAAETAIATCTSRTGCAYVPHDCYCGCRGYGATAVKDGAETPACFCYCAGGRPPSCQSTSG